VTVFPADVRSLSWAAEQLGIGVSTAYRLAAAGRLPGAFKVGAQWRVSVPRFFREVHGELQVEAGEITAAAGP
jgi:excisionase family DNA binding protein